MTKAWYVIEVDGVEGHEYLTPAEAEDRGGILDLTFEPGSRLTGIIALAGDGQLENLYPLVAEIPRGRRVR